MIGKLLIFSAPSGSGKSTIVQHLIKQNFGLAFSISATSRMPRKGEEDGRDYYFISPGSFHKKIGDNSFIEWEEVYTGQYYGTLRSEVDRIWNNGKHALFDIDVVGGLNLKKEYGDRACAIFVKPPSLDVLEERLRLRGTDDKETLQKRLGKAGFEMQFADQFDHVVVNDNLEQALSDSENLVKKFLEQ